MCTWRELRTCSLCMKIKSIKENETRVNTLLNQFTYKLQKKQQKHKQTKKKKTKQNKTNLFDLPNLEKKNKETYRRSFRHLTI